MESGKIKILCFGEVLFDIIDGRKHLGGAPLNVAAHVVRRGAQAAIISAVGDDIFGREAISRIRALGINTAFIQTDKNHPTGKVEVSLTPDKIPVYNICRETAYDYICFRQAEIDKISSPGWNAFCFGTLAQRNDVSRQSLSFLLDRFSGTVFYDVNLRQDFFSREIIAASLQRASIVKLNGEEAGTLARMFYGRSFPDKEFCGRLANDFALAIVIVTFGADGCGVFHGGKYHKVPSPPAKVVDTVGAGDAFSAAFICDFLAGKEIHATIVTANRVAAEVVSHHGAIPCRTATDQPNAI